MKTNVALQSDWQLVGTGGVVDLGDLAAYEGSIPEGDMFQVSLQLRTAADASIGQSIKSQMLQRGIPNADVQTSGNTMRIYGRKGFPWLAVIAAIILAALVLVIILVSWNLFKKVVPVGLQGTIGTVAIIGIVILLIGFGTSQARKTRGN
jgi:hypothetical protein